MSESTIKHLWALDAPTMSVDCSVIMLGTGGTQIPIPIPVFLIEHEHGLVMFDTSLATQAATDPEGAYGPLAQAFAVDFPAGYTIEAQLGELGFTTSDVTGVILSHMHFDHTGGLELFAGVQGFIGEGELRYARTPRTLDDAFFREADVAAAAQINWNEIPVGYDHDLFGDGSVVILSLPGHTPGALGLKLRLPDGRTIILTGDAAHLRDSVKNTIGMPFDVDSVSKHSSLLKVKLLANQPNTTVWISHDPEDWADNRPNGRQIV